MLRAQHSFRKLGHLGFRTESNNRYLVGVWGPILMSTTEVTWAGRERKSPSQSSWDFLFFLLFPALKRHQTSTMQLEDRRPPPRGPPMRRPPHPRAASCSFCASSVGKKEEKIETSTNSNFGFHIGYSVCQPKRTSGGALADITVPRATEAQP